MVRTGFTSVMVIVVLLSLECTQKPKQTEGMTLVQAMIYTESGGDSNAYNGYESARGVLQIRPIYVKDINRILREDVYTNNDCYNPSKSIDMFRIYTDHYGKRYTRITGRPVTDEVRARMHNGGPNGWKKSATDVYWDKIKRYM